MPSLVEKGNTIHVPAESFDGDKGRNMTVSWQQQMKKRNQDYWVCTYTVKSGGNSEGVIYIQTDKLDEFKSRKADGEDFTLTVDERFQYGQGQKLTKRFLVFHDTNNKPYQHRFVENTLTKYGGKALDVNKQLGHYDLSGVVDFAKASSGHYLHNY